MYKLVVVGGKLRGKEFVLEEGENVVGSDDGCDVCIAVGGISKRHVSVTVTNDVCYVEDMGSSNGTFVNGKLTKKCTVKNGDKIALPDTIIQVVYVTEKKKIIKKASTLKDEPEEHDYLTGGVPPAALPQKLLWLFKYRFMNFIHGINEEYEWRVLFGIMVFIFIIVTVTATIFPVLRTSRMLLLREVATRGNHYAEEIVRLNSRNLDLKRIDKVDTTFLDREKSVQEYRLFDLEGRVIRPSEMINEYISTPFFIQVKDYYEKIDYQDKAYIKRLSGNVIGVGRLINAYNPKTGVNEPIGMIALKFSPSALQIEGAVGRRAYVESLITTILVAIIFFLVIYYLTIRPIDEMKHQIEDAITGKIKLLEGRWLMEEMNGLRGSVNALVQRVRELSGEADDDFAEEEGDEEYTSKLSEIMKGTDGAALVLDSEKNIAYINAIAEDLTGIRESASQGSSIMDVSRERGFAATVVELCETSANDGGNNTEGNYELGGHDYTIHVAALIGKDSFAKAFYVTFVKS